ncbi:MAG: arsenate reductase ArsC [Caldisericia bacterium]|nr:arsenate reductase ArsC [Caldisericia bacterium]
MSEKPRILFLCTGNSCRSQMAEGWTRFLKGDLMEAYSAGTEPQRLNPNAVKVMKEMGVDISNQHSKHIQEFQGTLFDVVVTVCDHAHETCPFFPTKNPVIHKGFLDPSVIAEEIAKKGASEKEQLDWYRKVRDEIRAFVETLPDGMNIKGEVQ